MYLMERMELPLFYHKIGCFMLINFHIFITAIGFITNMTTASLALYITRKTLYRICYKVFHLYLNRFNRRVHQSNPFVLSVRWVLNTFVLNVVVIHTAKYVSLKCIPPALFSKHIKLNIWMHFPAQLEMYSDYVAITERNWCTIARSARCQFATLALVHRTANMIRRLLPKWWVRSQLINFGSIIQYAFLSFRMKWWTWTSFWRN